MTRRSTQKVCVAAAHAIEMQTVAHHWHRLNFHMGMFNVKLMITWLFPKAVHGRRWLIAAAAHGDVALPYGIQSYRAGVKRSEVDEENSFPVMIS